MQMIINYTDQYDEAILTLIENYPMEWGYSVPTILALEKDEVVGIGSLSRNDFHPYREYIKIFVQPENRKMGIGRELFDALLYQSKQKKFQTSISSKDEVAISFLGHCGFGLARKCYTPILRNDAPIISIYFPTMQEQPDAIQNEVFRLQLDNYREFHQAINPLNERISFHQWKEMLCENLDLNRSYILLKDEEVVAYVLCYEGDAPGKIEIGYVGGRNISSLEEYEIFYKQVADQLIQDFGVVEIEADDVDPYASALLNQFAYDQSDSFDAYLFG